MESIAFWAAVALAWLIYSHTTHLQRVAVLQGFLLLCATGAVAGFAWETWLRGRLPIAW